MLLQALHLLLLGRQGFFGFLCLLFQTAFQFHLEPQLFQLQLPDLKLHGLLRCLRSPRRGSLLPLPSLGRAPWIPRFISQTCTKRVVD